MVSERDLPNTRLVITGFDSLGLGSRDSVTLETIPMINEVLLRSFLIDAAAHLGHEVDPEDLDEIVVSILGDAATPRSLSEIESVVVAVVKERWSAGVNHGG